MAAPARVTRATVPSHGADAAEVVVLRRPAAHRPARHAPAGRAPPRRRPARRARAWRRRDGSAGRVTAATGSSPSSRIDAATPTSAVLSRVPPAEPIASTSPSSSKARLGAIMLSIRAPGTSGTWRRSTSPSMLFRCRSSPGRKSPVPRPRLVVSTQALPSRVDDGRGSSCGPRERVRRGRRAARALAPARRAPAAAAAGPAPWERPRAPLRVRNRVPANVTSTGPDQSCFVASRSARVTAIAVDPVQQRLGERAVVDASRSLRGDDLECSRQPGLRERVAGLEQRVPRARRSRARPRSA